METPNFFPQINADERGSSIQPITEAIIGAAFQVSNVLGCGFLEKVYENALAYELRRRGHHVQQQLCLNVLYDGVVVGQYVADLIVNDTVIVEIKNNQRVRRHPFGAMPQLFEGYRQTGLLIA
jgi:GxxExxY protein